MLHLYVHLHMFACMTQVLNSISMLVWCMLDHRKMIDEMKTSMHRKSNYTCAYHVKTRPFHIMFVSQGFLVFVNV